MTTGNEEIFARQKKKMLETFHVQLALSFKTSDFKYFIIFIQNSGEFMILNSPGFLFHFDFWFE